MTLRLSLSFLEMDMPDFSISGSEDGDMEIPSLELGSKWVGGTLEVRFEGEDSRRAFVNSFCDLQI